MNKSGGKRYVRFVALRCQKLTFVQARPAGSYAPHTRPFAANAAGAESGRSSQSRWRDRSWLGSSRSDLALRRWPRTARSTPRERRLRLRARPFERLAIRRINQPAAAGHAAPSEVVESQQPADRNVPCNSPFKAFTPSGLISWPAIHIKSMSCPNGLMP